MYSTLVISVVFKTQFPST